MASRRAFVGRRLNVAIGPVGLLAEREEVHGHCNAMPPFPALIQERTPVKARRLDHRAKLVQGGLSVEMSTNRVGAFDETMSDRGSRRGAVGYARRY